MPAYWMALKTPESVFSLTFEIAAIEIKKRRTGMLCDLATQRST